MRSREREEEVLRVIRGTRKREKPGQPGTRHMFVLLWALGAASPAFAADEIHWTITGQTSVTFDWRGSLAENTLSFGTAPGEYTDTVTAVPPSPLPNASAGPFWEARLTDLEEDTRYFYRIGEGPEHTFRTPPPRGSSDFWIAEEADIGNSRRRPTVGTTQVQIAQDHPAITGDDRPRFVLVPGDLTYADQSGRAADVDQHFNDVMAWAQDAAYMVIWGNHDYGDPVDDLDEYKGRFDFPNSQTSPGAPAVGGLGEDWYWFDYGHVRFIAYPDPYTSQTWPDWETQVAPIMAAAQADPAITFIVTFGHRPAYSTGSHATYNPDGTFRGEAQRLARILDRLRANHPKYVLNINGHSHNYERTCPITGAVPDEACAPPDQPEQGLVHITGAGGGDGVEGLVLAQRWTVVRANHLAHLRIHFTPGKIEGFVVCGPDVAEDDDSCSEGAILDRWAILGPDDTPPSTTASASPAPNAAGWNKEPVTVTLAATDAPEGSGVKEIQFSLTGAETRSETVSGDSTIVTISAEGITTLTFFARDNTGNEEAPTSLTVQIDTTPPVVAGASTPGPNAAGWNNTDVTVSFTALDALSGIETVSSPVTVSSAGAGQEVTGTATDRAGNSASVSVTLNIDKTAPEIAGLPATGCILWPPEHQLVQAAAVTASDGLSGVAPGGLALSGISNESVNGLGDGDTSPDIVISGGAVQLRAERSAIGTGRTYTLMATASDLAGNPALATASCTVPHDQGE